MIKSQVQVSVRYAETDMMGVVYHGSYLPWFEIGRTTLLKEHGISYRDLEAAGYRLPVLEVHVKYLKPACYDDGVTVITTLAERPLLRIELSYEVRRDADQLATGRPVPAFIHRDGRPVRPTANFPERLRELFA